MRGRSHQLHSGAALARNGQVVWSGVDTVEMKVRDFSDAFLDAYLAAEGEALLSLVREQRLAHALHTAAQGHGDGDAARDLAQVAAGSGFASIPAFCDACVDVAGIRPSLFLRG